MFQNSIKTTLRNAWKNKGYSFLNIFGLAIGIACAGLIFLWAEDELNWDKNHDKKDRIYQVQVTKDFGGKLFTMGSVPRPMASAIRAEIPGIVNAARYSDQAMRILFGLHEKSIYSTGRYTDGALFEIFSIKFLEGDAKNPFPQLHSLVITESTAKKVFNSSSNVVGKTLRVDNKQDYLITGLVADLPANSSLQFEWLAPYDLVGKQVMEDYGVDISLDWKSYGPYTYVELAKTAHFASVNSQIKEFIHRKDPTETGECLLYPMSSWRLYGKFENGKESAGGRIEQVRLLTSIAWIILLIACINFMNLATASSQKRAKEVGVRKVLGAERRKLIFQFMGEALVMSLAATIVSIAIMYLSLPAFNQLMQKQLELAITRPVHITALFGITFICALIAGSYPSLYLSSFNPISVLKGMKLKSASAAFIRKGLVVLQFSVSVIFIIGTLIVFMQIQKVQSRDLGFKKENLIEIDPIEDVSNVFPVIKNDFMRSGIIANVALADHQTLYGGDSDNAFEWQGKSPDNRVPIAHRHVSPEYINTSGMKIIGGRDFSDNAGAESMSAIINESMEKMMGEGSAVGKIVASHRHHPERTVATHMTVIGVVSDYVYGNIYGSKPGPAILFCRPPQYKNFIYVRLRENANAKNVVGILESVMKKNNPSFPLEYKFVDDQFNEMYRGETQMGKTARIFASLAIIISCLGLFGLVTFTAEQRRKEIGIRKVLGSSVANITVLLSREFMRLVTISCLVAFPLAWWFANNWLANYEYRIDISWWIFIAAGLVAISIALATISFQAIKAALANPVKSLRTE